MIKISSRDNNLPENRKCPLCPNRDKSYEKCSDCPKPVYQRLKEFVLSLFKKKKIENVQEVYDREAKKLDDYFKSLEENND